MLDEGGRGTLYLTVLVMWSTSKVVPYYSTLPYLAVIKVSKYYILKYYLRVSM